MSEIYLKQGDAYVAMTETDYKEEKILQELIERHPEMLAGDDAPHDKLILVRREAGISQHADGSPRWSLDHLYLDAKGTPTLVEVKRSTDTRSRREVVAQMLDYAAHTSVSFSGEKMAAWLEEAARADGRPGIESAGDLLREDLGVEDPDQFWRDVDTRLEAERFRLIFVADKIGRTLQRIIEFLNSQMTNTEVLAIEVKQYTDGDGKHQTIVPTVVGNTTKARETKSSPGGSSRSAQRKSRRWTRAEWLELHDERAKPEDVEVTRRLLAWADSNQVDVAFGTAMNHPTMKFERTIGDRSFGVVRLWPDGTVEINLGHLAAPLNDMAGWRRLAERLERIDGVTIPADRLGKFPVFPSQLLRSERQLAQLIETIEWAFDAMQRATDDSSPEADSDAREEEN